MDERIEASLKGVMIALMAGWALYFLVAIYIKYFLPNTNSFIKVPPSIIVIAVWTFLLAVIGGLCGTVLFLKKQEPSLESHI